jgi:uncharacterized lipoprotein
MTRTLKVMFGAAAALALMGCRSITGSCHDPAPYTRAESAAPLEIPPGLDSPDTRNALKIPELKEPAPPRRKEGDPCLEAPPKYQATPPREA